MLKWRPLTQEELPALLSADIVQLRQNYLYNPERLPVTYVEAQCIEKRKRDGTFLLNGSDIPIAVSLTEVGRYVETGWQMTGEFRIADAERSHFERQCLFSFSCDVSRSVMPHAQGSDHSRFGELPPIVPPTKPRCRLHSDSGTRRDY
jgi:hypothetical protein